MKVGKVVGIDMRNANLPSASLVGVALAAGLLLSLLFADAWAPLIATHSFAEEADDYVEEARLATEKIGDGFGSAVAIDGNTAVVSSQSGYAVYIRSGGAWIFQDLLVPSDGAPANCSPRPVDLDNDTIVAGCSSTTVGSNLRQGAAYVFVRNGSTWSEQKRLTASDGVADDEFAGSVAISNNTIIVGAWRSNRAAAPGQGAAYVFERVADVWSEEAKLLAGDPSTSRLFGYEVRIDDDTAAVNSLQVQQFPPAVYVFTRSSGQWSQQTKLSVCESSGSSGTQCRFGTQGFAVRGDELAVGNPTLNVGLATAAGGVYIFGRNGNEWSQQQRIVLSNPKGSDTFGSSISMDVDTLVIGAPATNVNPGMVYAYRKDANGWFIHQQFSKTNNDVSDVFGASVDASGNRIIISRSRDNESTSNTIGAAYIFAGPDSGPVNAMISGQVLTPDGRGLRNAVVSLTDAEGLRRTVLTSSAGFYSFADVKTGETYTVAVSSKRYRFSPQNREISGDITEMDFIGIE